MFEVYLKEKINESGSKATIADGVAKFKFEKTDDELWNNLQAAEVEDKKFMAAARQKAVEDSHKRAEQLAEKKAKEKREQERFALREQMKVMFEGCPMSDVTVALHNVTPHLLMD